MIKTVIFDMDGVIVDTEPVHRYAYYQLFNKLQIEVSEEMFTSYTGGSTRNVFQKIKDHFQLSEDVEDLIQQKRQLFNDAFDTKKDLCLLDGVENLIQKLYNNGYQLILASSAANVTIKRVFDRFDLHKFFTQKLSGEDFPKSKPDPAIFIKAAQLSNHLFEECVVIEDSTNGVLAAKAANLKCIGYKSFHSKNQDLSKADFIVNDFNDVEISFFEKI